MSHAITLEGPRAARELLERHIPHHLSRDRPSTDAGELAVLFGGDRAACLDHTLVHRDDGVIWGLASIALRGEMGEGEPTLVGLWVDRGCRREGIARALVAEAARRCPEWGVDRLRVDAISIEAVRLFESLPAEIAARFRVIPCAWGRATL